MSKEVVKEQRWIYRGRECVLKKMESATMQWWCGYVESDLAASLDYTQVPAQVYGGLTFVGQLEKNLFHVDEFPIDDLPDDGVPKMHAYGFDTNHIWDDCPESERELTLEVEQLADQLIKFERRRKLLSPVRFLKKKLS